MPPRAAKRLPVSRCFLILLHFLILRSCFVASTSSLISRLIPSLLLPDPRTGVWTGLTPWSCLARLPVWSGLAWPGLAWPGLTPGRTQILPDSRSGLVLLQAWSHLACLISDCNLISSHLVSRTCLLPGLAVIQLGIAPGDLNSGSGLASPRLATSPHPPLLPPRLAASPRLALPCCITNRFFPSLRA